MVAEMARTRQSVFEAKVACSYCDVVTTVRLSPCTLVVLVVTAVRLLCSFACFSISAICVRAIEGGAISIPRIMSRTSDCVSACTFTLFFLP